MAGWIAENWVTILNAVGIIGGLFFTAISFRSEAKTRRIANLLTVTTNHREIWKEFFLRPELSRVLDDSANLGKQPVTPEEREFVNFVILHLSSVFYATKDDVVTRLEGLRQDTASFFSLPIPESVWEGSKAFQNRDFVAFVEECRGMALCFKSMRTPIRRATLRPRPGMKRKRARAVAAPQNPPA